jgi:cytochrome c556
MKKILRTGVLAAAAALVMATGVGGVSAQEDKAAVIKARQDFMEDQQHAVNAVNAFAKGQGSREAAVDGANKLVDLSKQLEAKIVALFPAGTSSADNDKSKTKPELWQHLDEAKAAPAKLRELEVKLVDVVKTADPETVGTTMRNTYRDGCNGLCHDKFRVPQQRG